MESAAVRLYFLLEHNYSLVTMSCILHIIWVNSCTINKINFSKDNIARGLCTLVLFIQPVVAMECSEIFTHTCKYQYMYKWTTRVSPGQGICVMHILNFMSTVIKSAHLSGTSSAVINGTGTTFMYIPCTCMHAT